MTLLARLRHDGALPTAPQPGAVALEAIALSVELGGVRILHDVELALHHGEVVAVIGPNGAGKSTLLGALAGDVNPSVGDVELAGQPTGAWSAVDAARRRAVLLQDATIAFPFTVTEVVRMGRSPWAGTPREDDDDHAVAEAMLATDTFTLADRRVTTLSGGERARVAMARVLAQQTSTVLLDEPTAALDSKHQEELLSMASARAAEGAAVLVVMHDLGLAAAYAHRVVLLGSGRVRAIGPPEDTLTDVVLSDVYDCAIETFRHPRTGVLMVAPTRGEPR
jgi:iron complex transport system ATP-binding protein